MHFKEIKLIILYADFQHMKSKVEMLTAQNELGVSAVGQTDCSLAKSTQPRAGHDRSRNPGII